MGRITGINKSSNISRNVTYDAFDRINGLTLSLKGRNITSSVFYGNFGQVNSFTNTIGNKTDTISYTYDDFYRIKSRNLNGMVESTEYTYLKGQNGQDTTLVESFYNSKDNYSYEYDQYGNIISVYKEGILTEEYEYDDLNQLVWAKIGEDEYNYYYVGNSSNLEFVYKNGTIIKTYGYMPAGETWVDKLNSFTGTVINYDEIGNPLKWRNNITLSWEYGRRLKTVTADGNDISYTYDADGLRTSKTVNGVKTEYYWLDGVLQGQKTGSEYIIFLYDENGTAYGMLINQNGVENYYYYLFNLQGDIVGIMDSNGATVAEYTYDAWGQLLTTTGTLKDTIGQKNPLRYRGYYYDSETGFYYLKSRYYDPYVSRFINADGYASTGQGLTGYNMYAYCNNNPVNMTDSNGNMPKWLSGTLNVVFGAAQIVAGAALGVFTSWTGVGAVAAGILVANGTAMVLQGASQIINDATNTNYLLEENALRYTAQEIGYSIDGERGSQIAGLTYDAAVTISSIYAGKVSLEKSMPKIIESKIFSVNNGYGFKLGKNIEMFYRNPNAAGGPGGTIFSYKGPLGKFRIDWDPAHGFHCHPPGH